MEIVPLEPQQRLISHHLELFHACFPNVDLFSEAYLNWLYLENPDGHVVGYDAYDGDRLAATYVCIPAAVGLRGRTIKALLSLNTATGPDYRGQGLFTKLAAATYAEAARSGFEVVFGVANANSIRGFSAKLGFQDVAGLDARIGIGQFPKYSHAQAREEVDFARYWNADRLAWRSANPNNPLMIDANKDGTCWIEGRTQYQAINVQCGIDMEPQDISTVRISRTPLKLSLGLSRSGNQSNGLSLSIPDRLKPSPLRLIYRNLVDQNDYLDPDKVLFNFIDFDAY